MSNLLKTYGQPIVYRMIQPLIVLLTKAGVTPNTITLIGFLLNIGVAILLVMGADQPTLDLRYIGWAGALILFAGLFDMIDGRLARVSGTSSPFGALFDSVLDRYSELVMFLGICYYLAANGYWKSAFFAFLAMQGSLMVSYVRARAEGLGIECSDGMMQRPERIVLIGVSAIVCGVFASRFGPSYHQIDFAGLTISLDNLSIFTIPMFLLAVLANYTAYQRIQLCRKAMES
jgi:CDP-diacylglycerol---glycerol-3-phosphate 3-phosphatidyltransferase